MPSIPHFIFDNPLSSNTGSCENKMLSQNRSPFYDIDVSRALLSILLLIMIALPVKVFSELPLLPSCNGMRGDIDKPSGVLFFACIGQGVWAVNGTTYSQILTNVECQSADSLAVHPNTSSVIVSCSGGITQILQVPFPWKPHTFIPYSITYPCIDLLYSVALAKFACNANSAIYMIDGRLSSPPYLLRSCPSGARLVSIAVSSTNAMGYMACDIRGAIAIDLSNGITDVLISTAGPNYCENVQSVGITQDNYWIIVGCRDEGLFILRNQYSVAIQLSFSCQSSNTLLSTIFRGSNVILAGCSSSVREYNLNSGTEIILLNAATTGMVIQPNARLLYSNISGADIDLHPLVIASSLITVCNAGEYGVGGRSPCSKCAAGTFTSFVGDSSCRYLCPSGTYGSTIGAIDSSRCIPCASGTYNLYNGSSICTSCEPGSYNLNSGSSKRCIKCSPGTFTSDLGSSSICALCSTGKYANDTGASSCTSCSFGKYNPLTGSNSSLSCLLCDPGTISSQFAASICDSCLPGTYSTDSGSTICLSCPNGTYSNYNGQSVCTACSPGTFNQYTRRSSIVDCISCSPGRFQLKEGSDHCEPCPIGAYSSSGSVFCLSCPPGTYQNVSGSLLCTSCPQNTYQPLSGAIDIKECKSCPPSAPSSPAASTSSLQCVVPSCPDGAFSDGVNGVCQTLCPKGSFCKLGVLQLCPAGTYSDVLGSSVCISCRAGTYNSMVGASSSFECKSCPMATYSSIAASFCILCGAGNTTLFNSSTSSLDCTPISKCSKSDGTAVRQICPLLFNEPISLSELLPIGQRMVAMWSEKGAEKDEKGWYNSYYSRYSPSRSSVSLRTKIVGDASDASQSTTSTKTKINLIFIIEMILIVVAIVPLLIFHHLPAKPSLLLDRFSWNQSAPSGGVKKRQPSQFGAALSITFLFAAVVVGLFLCTSSNTDTKSSLIPPSSLSESETAVSNIGVTLKVYMGIQNIEDSCRSGVNTEQSGFSNFFSVQIFPDLNVGACNVILDCNKCTLTGPLSLLNLSFPYSSQLIEWELSMTGATPGSISRRYGALSQQPGHLMDRRGELKFSAIESVYQDLTGGSTSFPLFSGYDMDFIAYSQKEEQPITSFNSESKVELSFTFTKSPVIFQTLIVNRMSILQQVTLTLSAISSLFGAFAILYGVLHGYAIPILRINPGYIVDDDGDGKRVYIQRSGSDKVLPYFSSSDEEKISTPKSLFSISEEIKSPSGENPDTG
jgi:hypothetical protein